MWSNKDKQQAVETNRSDSWGQLQSTLLSLFTRWLNKNEHVFFFPWVETKLYISFWRGASKTFDQNNRRKRLREVWCADTAGADHMISDFTLSILVGECPFKCYSSNEFTSFSGHRPARRECARTGLKSHAKCHPYPIPHPVKVGHTTGMWCVQTILWTNSYCALKNLHKWLRGCHKTRAKRVDFEWRFCLYRARLF